jgi:hypothetical protein
VILCLSAMRGRGHCTFQLYKLRAALKDGISFICPLMFKQVLRQVFGWPSAKELSHIVRKALMTAPVLVLPDFDKPFEVVTDACDKPPAVGGVLSQEGRPVAYYSRKLSGAELNYSATDKEMLGVIGALREWRCYLEGRRFVIVTDHKPNTYLDTASNVHTVKRRARWLEESSGYDYEWQYREGRINVADPISRAPQHFSLLCHVAPQQPEQVLALVNIVHGNDFVVDTYGGCTNCAMQSPLHTRLSFHPQVGTRVGTEPTSA